MRFQVLGSVAIRLDGREETLTGRLERALLALLLAHAGQSVPADVLTNALWGSSPDPRLRQRLQLQVHRLRRKLGEEHGLASGPVGYRLTVGPGELDAERFESLVDEALVAVAHDDPRGAVGPLRAALGLWRGTPFAGLDVPILDDWRHRLAERRLVALETLYESELAGGRHTEVVAELTSLVREHPLRERFHGLLMTALSRAGRQAEALAAYHTARKALVGELGLEPGPELRELERRILAGEEVGRERPGPPRESYRPPARESARGALPSPPGEARRSAPPRAPEAASRARGGHLPAQLPLEVPVFVGRDAELSELDDLLATTPAAVAALAGTAGVGKTALAVHWAHRARDRFPDGQLYVDLRGYGPDQPLAPQDALAGFLRALGMEGRALPQSLPERAARFRTLTAGRRMLIVLDNAHTVAQVRPLLPGGPSCFTLVTSRDALAGLVAREGAHRVRLERLPPTDAHRLLRELLGGRAGSEPEAAEALVERCVRLPLALRIAGELIRSHPALTVAGLAEELAERQGVLDLLDLDDDPHTAVRPVFSWSYGRLAPAEARVFRLVGLHPGPDTDAHAVAALAGRGVRETRRSLDVLLRAHLVEQTGKGRYRQHDLLRDYAAELAADEAETEAADADGAGPAAERPSALDRLRGHYLHLASAAMDLFAPHDYAPRPKVPSPDGPPWDGPQPLFADHERARHWLERERANLLEVTRHADPAYVIAMSETLHLYLRVGGYLDEALTLHRRALRAARTTGDAVAEAHARRVLGTMTHLSGGDLAEATDHFRRALTTYEETGDRALHASVLSSLGFVRQRSGDLTGAMSLYERALALNGSDGNWRVRCAVLVNMGRTLRTLARLDEARACLEKVLALCESHGDRSVEANAHCVLADVHTRRGDEDAAFAHAHRGMALARESGYRQMEAVCLTKLGTLHRGRGELEPALRLHEEALALAREVGDGDLTAEALNALATTHAAAERPERALRLHQEALALATRAGERTVQAHAHSGIAEAHTRLGDPTAARDHLRRALALYTSCGLPEAERARTRLDRLERATTRVTPAR
ncbi:AfsR/SARP family transcriptional regulator [Streptomyces sp. 4N509B]|uniref:AfsR/SARP family transcriptional regulator n=1 Tax=Streptomyces sp. 4N509B TaxID=3457413 RepID=UPI003FD56454